MNLNNQPFASNSTTRANSPEWGINHSHYQRFYSINTFSQDQQIRIKNNLDWRQKTSMPIVKVVSYKVQQNKDKNCGYQNIFRVQLQSIIKSIDSLFNINLSQAIYIIRQSLLGVQTLTIKYNAEFDVSKWLIGINNKGQIKVWLSNNLIKEETDNTPLFMSLNIKGNKTNHIIQCLFELVKHCVQPTSKPIFQMIGKKLVSQSQLTFAEAHCKLRQLCLQNKTIICNFLKIDKFFNNKFGSVQKSIKNSVERKFKKINQFQQSALSKNLLTHQYLKQPLCFKNTFKSKKSFNSPKHSIKVPNSKGNKWHPSSNSKSKVIWSYTNSATKFNKIQNKLLGSVNRGNISEKKDQSALNQNNKTKIQQQYFEGVPYKTINLCKSVPNKLNDSRLKSQNAKNQPKQNKREEVIIQQFNPYEQEDHSIQILKTSQIKSITSQKVQSISTNTRSLKNQQQSKLSFDGSLLLQNFNQSKKSGVTTNNSLSSTQRAKDSIQQFKQKCFNLNKLQQMIDSTKTIVNSIMIQTPLVSRVNQKSSRMYDFGGLITIEDKGESASVSGNGQISGKQVQSLEASREDSVRSIQKTQINRVQIHNQNGIKIDFDLLCGVDLMSKFFANDYKDLKQSVWCGQEKRAEHLHIKLQKLGHLGRQIKASFVPETNEQRA